MASTAGLSPMTMGGQSPRPSPASGHPLASPAAGSQQPQRSSTPATPSGAGGQNPPPPPVGAIPVPSVSAGSNKKPQEVKAVDN